MRHVRAIAVSGTLFMTGLLGAGCTAISGSGTGETRTAEEERVGAQAIKEIPPQDFGDSSSRAGRGAQTELAGRDMSGSAKGSLKDVLFDFDRDTLRTDVLPILEANARLLKDDGVRRVILEGRGDEVGTAAYNIVLGERRAKNVKVYLEQLGLAVDLKTTSYGKDRPLCFERSSDCMQKNRSVHFVVRE